MAVADVEDLRDVDVAVQLERPLAAEVLVFEGPDLAGAAAGLKVSPWADSLAGLSWAWVVTLSSPVTAPSSSLAGRENGKPLEAAMWRKLQRLFAQSKKCFLAWPPPSEGMCAQGTEEQAEAAPSAEPRRSGLQLSHEGDVPLNLNVGLRAPSAMPAGC
ncbi:hypothetical protein WR25_17299 [Diploscapter pachys]|uniref:Uncharacterized protein n=1 Tax=Diploscapter pachys TaxID=2018661 RepID=A0A2A2K7P3_9BILA|nr:hypothetical protein WR25_17299 [Diploscapter pachys]